MISIGNDRAEIIIQELVCEKILPESGLFEITNELLTEYVNRYNFLFGKNKLTSLKGSNKRFAYKLAGLTFIKLNKRRIDKARITKNKISITNLKFGFIYVISNPAFPGMFKVGMTQDLEKRLSQYQTYDPFRKFKIEHIILAENRRLAERELLNKLSVNIVNGEWVTLERVHEIFRNGVNSSTDDCYSSSLSSILSFGETQ